MAQKNTAKIDTHEEVSKQLFRLLSDQLKEIQDDGGAHDYRQRLIKAMKGNHDESVCR